MNPIVQALKDKQTLTTAVVASAAFLLALPIGAAMLPSASAMSDNASSQVGCVEAVNDLTAAVKAATTSHTGGSTTSTSTGSSSTHTDTQTSSNNSGSTAQVGHNGVAAAVTVGDVLSNNDIPVLSNNTVSVPVLSNNTTTVSPVTTVSPKVNLLSNNGDNGVLGIKLLSL